MSAPTSLDGGALARELARRVPRPRRAPADRRAARRGPDRRRQGALAALARTHDLLCTQAVDPSEIAAGLEAAGVGDRQARVEHGVASVFELAELLHARVPRRPADVSPPADPWHRPWTRSLLAGALHSTPGVLYAGGLGLLPPGTGLWLLIAASVAATGLGQGLSLLAHVLLGRGDAAASGRLLRGGLLSGLAVLAGLLAVAAPAGGLPVPAALLVGGQLLYLFAAIALVVAGAEVLLLALLAPGVLLATLLLTGVVPGGPALPAVLGGTVVVVVAAAWGRTPRGPGTGLPVERADARLTGVHVGWGVVTAGLLAFPVVDLLTGTGPPQAHVVALVMAPLVLSLGLADLLVHRCRSDAWQALHDCTSPAAFRQRTERLLLRSVGAYAAALAALTAGVVAGAGGDRALALDAAACGVLGTALLVGALLVSLGRAGTAVAAGAGALALDTALRPLLGGRLAPAWEPAQHLLVFAVLLLVLLPLVQQEYGRVTRHR